MCGPQLYLGLFCNLKRVIHLYPKIPNSALQPGVPEQELHCTQVLGLSVNQRSFFRFMV